MNQCNFIGNLGRDPEIKTLFDGTKTAKFSIAVSKKKGDGRITRWVNCQMFRATAEIAEKYLHKGDQVCVSGELWEREYTGRDGEVKKIDELTVNNLYLIGKKSEAAGEPAQAKHEPEPTAPVQEDDIPF